MRSKLGIVIAARGITLLVLIAMVGAMAVAVAEPRIARAASPVPGTIATQAGAPGAGQALSIGQVPFSLAALGDHVYVGDSANPVIRDVTWSTGAEGILAGNDGYGYTGNPAQGVASMINGAGAIAQCGTDTYFADTYNYVIRRVDASGNLTTVAGTGQPGYSGDGGPATSAKLSRVFGLACRTGGGLYISDSDNGAIRILSPTGTIDTWYSGFVFPAGIVEGGEVDYLYVADSGSSTLWVLSDIYPPQDLAGTGVAGYNGDGYAPTSELNHPFGLALYGGTVYIADTDNNRIREYFVGALGIGTFLGDGTAGFTGDGGLYFSAEINHPESVLYYSSACGAQLLVADTGNDRVRDVHLGSCSLSLNQITTLAGNGSPSWSGDGGAASSAQLGNPYAVAFDGAGDEYLADNQNNAVREITPGGTITTVAGQPTQPAGFAGDGGPATSALLNGPAGLVVDSVGDVYISDAGNQRIRRIDHVTKVISTVAGNGLAGSSGDGAGAALAKIDEPRGLALDGAGNLYIADTQNNRVRMVTPGGVISTFAGTGKAEFGGDAGPATSAGLDDPRGLAFNAQGDLFISDAFNQRVRRVDHLSHVITTYAGNGAAGLSGDGHAAVAGRLDLPYGLAFDNVGDLYIADTGNNRVRLVDPAGNMKTVVDDCGAVTGFTGDGGPASIAKINLPFGLAIGPGQDIYVADVNNNRIREVLAPVDIRNGACPSTPATAHGRVGSGSSIGAAGPRVPTASRHTPIAAASRGSLQLSSPPSAASAAVVSARRDISAKSTGALPVHSTSKPIADRSPAGQQLAAALPAVTSRNTMQVSKPQAPGEPYFGTLLALFGLIALQYRSRRQPRASKK